jgi:hypothetical protein
MVLYLDLLFTLRRIMFIRPREMNAFIYHEQINEDINEIEETVFPRTDKWTTRAPLAMLALTGHLS